MMKVAFLTNHFPRLSETFILNQITGLIDRGHKVDIFAVDRGNEEKVHGDVIQYDLLSRTSYHGETRNRIPSNRMRRFGKGFALLFQNYHNNPRAFLNSLNIFKYGMDAASLRILYKIVPFVGKGDFDAVICHFGPNGILGVFLRELSVFKGKIITIFHGYDITEYVRKHGRDVYNDLFEKGDLFLPISERWKEELIRLGCSEEKIKVHHMGINPRRYHFLDRNKNDSDTIRILSVARFVEKKGIRYGVEAIGKIAGEHSKIEYRIVGDGPLRGEIESTIDQMGIRDRVKLLGWKSQEEILRLMAESDILFAPSITSKDGDQEGIPVVLMEAMAMGIPVVSTLHSGIPELVQDGISGFLAPEGDVQALTEKLRRCIEQREFWPRIGEEGRKTVVENFNIDTLNDRLVDLSRQLGNSGNERIIGE